MYYSILSPKLLFNLYLCCFAIFLRPRASQTKRKLVHVRSSTTPSSGTDVDVELEFNEDKPNQLAPLEKDVADGSLANMTVLPKMKSGTLATKSELHRTAISGYTYSLERHIVAILAYRLEPLKQL